MATQVEGLITREEATKIVNPIVAGANELTVTSQEDRDFACSLLVEIANRKKFFDERHDPNIKRWHEGHKAACADKKTDVEPLLTAEKMVKGKIVEYDAKKEEEDRAEEARRSALAKEEADAAALVLAQKLEAQGESELASKVVEEAVSAPAPIIPIAPSVQKFSGVASREDWDVRIINEALIPEQFIIRTVDLKTLKAMAKAQKNLMRVPGVQAFRVNGLAVRATR